MEGMSSVLSVPGLWHSSQGLSSWEPWEPGWPLLLQRAAAAGLLGFVGIEAALGRVGCVGWLGMGGNGGSARQSRAQQSPEQLWEGRAGLNWTNPGLKPQSRGGMRGPFPSWSTSFASRAFQAPGRASAPLASLILAGTEPCPAPNPCAVGKFLSQESRDSILPKNPLREI